MLNTNSAELSTMEREWSCGGGGGDGGGVCDRNTVKKLWIGCLAVRPPRSLQQIPRGVLEP